MACTSAEITKHCTPCQATCTRSTILRRWLNWLTKRSVTVTAISSRAKRDIIGASYKCALSTWTMHSWNRLNCSVSVARDCEYWCSLCLATEEYKPQIIDVTKWGPPLRMDCNFRQYWRFEQELAQAIGSDVDALDPNSDKGPLISFYGSNDFHHLTLALFRRIRQPCNFVCCQIIDLNIVILTVAVGHLWQSPRLRWVLSRPALWLLVESRDSVAYSTTSVPLWRLQRWVWRPMVALGDPLEAHEGGQISVSTDILSTKRYTSANGNYL